jgi:hypothetical protein
MLAFTKYMIENELLYYLYGNLPEMTFEVKLLETILFMYVIVVINDCVNYVVSKIKG